MIYFNMVERDVYWPASADAYRLDYVLGSGSFGFVWQSTCLSGVHKEKVVAIKILDLEQFPNSNI